MSRMRTGEVLSAIADWRPSPARPTWGELCAWALARGHARAGDPAAIAGLLDDGEAFPHALSEFATVYADQTEGDFDAFLGAIKAGRIEARPGV